MMLKHPAAAAAVSLHLSSSTSWDSSVGVRLLSVRPSTTTSRGRKSERRSRSACIRCDANTKEAQQGGSEFVSAATEGEKTTTVKAVVSVKVTTGIIEDLLGKSLLLELVSTELDQETRGEKKTVVAYAYRSTLSIEEVKYEAEFSVPNGFGQIGAILVTNEHHTEMYLNNIMIMTGDTDAAAFTVDCRSWVHSKSDNPERRIFFTAESYLPSETPSGLVKLREKELGTLRGDGTGERKAFERIYDYDTYNDLGDPDVEGKARPVLGGSKTLPYPRRCRTGRPKTKKDPLSETRSARVYVPRDEAFSEVKQGTFYAKTLGSLLHTLVPTIETTVVDKLTSFPNFTAIDELFNEGVPLPKKDGILGLVKDLAEGTEDVLLFETPAMIDRDRFSWLRDDEFSRQTLAGVNPFSIQLVTEFPFVSKLDPTVYGPPESAITEDIINEEIRGIMTAKEALEQKKLFMLDYHDLLLPFVHKVREIEGTTLYGSLTVFFLTPDNTLKPIAIELTRPASPTIPQWKQVFNHRWDATGNWLWRLAKAHVCAHDAGYHELVSHFLRTHGCCEPYAIAMNRQLSAMHPIYRLLHPHFRYTMKINAMAREFLINGDGIIETSFSPRKHSMEISSVAYREQWRFDTEALPADLIRRGMAVEDPEAEHGLRLTIEDYPYANDGLLIWSSTKQWVTDYVNHYYPDPSNVQEDHELQNWWTEVRTKGHADKKDEPWWLVLNTQDNLVQVLTTIIWVSSAHHAAVNFGQYHFGGYFPNRPTIARTNMPIEADDPTNSDEFVEFTKKPEAALLKCFPSQFQATVVMAILDVLSTHSPDEEYLGEQAEPAWVIDPVINNAFERFYVRMKEIEGIIDDRNINTKLSNRCGAGIVPYELLKPFSEPGVTGKGIPNSVSI